MKKLILYITIFFSTITAQDFQYKLSICAVTQDEGRWLKEWIEYHLLTGVEHFWIYDNNSKDNSIEVLKPYIQQGIVELFDWPLSTHNHLAYLNMQIGAYNDVLKFATGKTEWLAFIDIDEFIVPLQEKTITETLDKRFSNCAGIVVNWQLYGTSLIEKIQPNELMVEMLTCRAPFNYQKHVSTKSIVKPHLVTECPDPHYFTYTPGHYNVDTHGQRYEHLNFVIYTDVLVINHYWFKDDDFFYKVKIPRYVIWSKNNQVLYRFYDILNQEEDRIMDRFIPELRDRVFGKQLLQKNL